MYEVSLPNKNYEIACKQYKCLQANANFLVHSNQYSFKIHIDSLGKLLLK